MFATSHLFIRVLTFEHCSSPSYTLTLLLTDLYILASFSFIFPSYVYNITAALTEFLHLEPNTYLCWPEFYGSQSNYSVFAG